MSTIPTVPTKKKANNCVIFDEKTKDAATVSVNKSRLLANLAHLDDSQQGLSPNLCQERRLEQLVYWINNELF